MASRRTVDLLPEIFRTQTNRQFFAATLDQLTQEPNIKRTQGYVGRRVGPGVNPADNYVTEPNATRTNYQLEPGVVFLKPETNQALDALTYPGFIDALDVLGARTQKQDRLWESQYYTWDPFCDLDKFVNYNQYYWLPGGPDSVDVATTTYALTDSWDITRRAAGYQFSDLSGDNPTITLVRGGSYTFNVNQPGFRFWIQAAPGVAGTMPATPNISSRDVLGVVNNGEDQGTITFNVPDKTAQNFYYSLTDIGTCDLVTDLKFNQLNNVYVSEFLAQFPNGIDGITNLDNRTVIFTNEIANAQDGGWQVTTQFDPLQQLPSNNGLVGSYDTTTFDQTTDITDQNQRYSIWQIQYILDDDGNPFMRLNSIIGVANLSKFTINFGAQWSSTQWYKNALGFFEQIPLLTAVLDRLYYQDSVSGDLVGVINLVDSSDNTPINIEDIIGARNYTSPNGVIFTNGLKVQFRGLVEPAQYQNLEYYVEGVGTGPGLATRVGFISGEAYFGPYHIYLGQKMTGAQHDDNLFQQYIYDTVAESLLNIGAGGPEGAPLPVDAVPDSNVGNGIKLLPVSDFVTPETYTRSESVPYDSTPYDAAPYDDALNAPVDLDYITINRASCDRNAWSRSNRWFHRDVIQYTAELNQQVAVFDNDTRGKRPIIEFRPNIRMWNFGTEGKTPVNIVDFQATDAFSNINGTIGYSVDGYNFITGSRVIFAADIDPDVRNKIYEVRFIDPNLSGTFIIDLVEVVNGDALTNQTVVSLSGVTGQGKSYWFDGLDWIPAQQKTSVNQPPLFDVYDSDGRSLGDFATYPSTTFAGSRLFGYAVGGTQIIDDVLGFSLRFLNINNVGDILFENYLYTDSFLYVKNSVSVTEQISIGTARQYLDRVSFSDLIGWQTAAAENRSRQVFRFTYADEPLILDVAVDQLNPLPPLQIFQGTTFIDPGKYTYTVTANQTTITLANPPAVGTILEVQAISDQASEVAYYQVPLNLENNPLNENSDAFTLGTIRTHYQTIGQNLRAIQGPIDGANNTRDLGDILRYGDNIVQHSSPLALAGVFLRRQQFEAIAAIEFNSREYQKYKALLLDLATRGDFINSTPSQVLDDCITEIALGRTDISPFYWSDMCPSGENFRQTIYPVTPITTDTFDTLYVYDYTSSNFQGMLVYLNDQLLIRGYDYVVNPDSATITISVALAVGDTVTIREYQTTYGSFVPNTPTKMGLYPAYKPEIVLDTSYLEPTFVIRGHDGSITVAFGDYRDQVLLEFETRIFNNIKIATAVPLTAEEVIPGQFRTTDYTLAEINTILATDFLTWVGWNKIDYASQTYVADDAFTYNYSQSANKLTRQPLLGAWRGIYQFFYDTVAPTTRPWEMLGFSERPSWWEDYYGPAPYTSGNLVLWEDLSQGLVRDPAGEYIRPEYARPDLLSVIPAGTEGELLPPLDATVGNYDVNSFKRSWAFGDGGPVEYVWRASSAYPFAIMRLLALTKPAKFFSLFADRDRYVFDQSLDQYLWDGRYRLDASQLAPLYGDGVSKASFINWLIDYNRQLGVNSTDRLTDTLNNIDVRLCWRAAGFTDKRYLRITTERSTPNSSNAGLVLPDESYQILLYKNQPFDQVAFSSVIVQITEGGYQVFGYDTVRPYFEVLVSRPGQYITIEAGGSNARISVEYTEDVVQVPYGFTFKNRTAVCDFLASYGKYLEQNGFVFDTRENGYEINWIQMAQEFLYWSNQGWAPGGLINLNPGAVKVSVTKPGAVADSLADLRPENLILNQDRQPLPASDLVIERLDNTIAIRSLSNNTINFANLSFTAFEHLVILDNRSIFADLIYDPVTGARQSRVLVSGIISGDWNGTVNAPGFVLNENNIAEWVPNQIYTKGEIVLFKDEYWSASTIIQPSEQFDYNLWIRSDYDQIQKGLLSNAPNAADQLAKAYDTFDASLQTETDLFSFGLIGFRPREYMQALNLDDISQVQLYQQFLPTKGTIRAAEVFSLADLGKEVAEYQINEYWSILKSQYGATANRNYIEMLLNAALLKSDPSLVEIVQPQETSQADQPILLQNLWKTSRPYSTTDIFPTVLAPVSDAALPTAGYVNLDDVDFSVFDLQDFNQTQTALTAALGEIGVGSTIWVAKINQHDWNIYRVESVPGHVIAVSDNLDGRALVQFDKQPNLEVNDYLIIKYFDSLVDGVYQVKSVPSLTSLTIDYTFTGTQTQITGVGLAFTLQTARVAQASDAVLLPYADNIAPGSRVWVDNDGFGRWQVIEKTNPFAPVDEITPSPQIENSLYGTSVTQGSSNLSALVGAPGLGSTGSVYTYVKTDSEVYSQNIIVDLAGTIGATGLGNAIDMGDNTWTVVGAKTSLSDHGYALVIYNPPTANSFTRWQLLVTSLADAVTAADEFGYSVTMSRDERWIYVGAPGANRVYAYGRVDVQEQNVEYTTDGSTTQFNWFDHLVVDSSSQIAVILDGVTQILNTDYVVDSQNIIFLTAPSDGLVLDISRKAAVFTVGDGLTTDYFLDDIYTADNIYSFSVYVNDVLLRPTFDYNYVVVGPNRKIVFTLAPGNGVQILIRATDYYRRVATINPASFGISLAADARFGHSVSTTTDGRMLLVGCPDDDVTVSPNTYNSAGRVYSFDRSVQRFQVQDASVVSYTTEQSLSSPGAPINVYLNGQILLDQQGNIGGGFSISANTVTIDVPIAVGDTIDVETNQFSLVQSITSDAPSDGANFGWSVDQCVNDCSLYVGAPFDSTVITEAGHVEFEQNQSRIYGSIESRVANPTLIASTMVTPQFLRVNDYWVELLLPTWSSAQTWSQGQLVINGSSIYRAIQNVPVLIDILDQDYWRPSNWSAAMAYNINSAAIPNAVASLTTDVEYFGDAVSTEFAVGNLYSSADSYTPLVYIDNVQQASPANYSYDAVDETIVFVSPPNSGARITIIGSRLVLSVKNLQAAVPFDRLTVLPGQGTVFALLDLDTYVYSQTITSPYPQLGARFGQSLAISDNTTTLLVGSPNGTAVNFTTFDEGTTFFDAAATQFVEPVPQSGAAYTFDFLPSANASATNPGQFVFGQQLYDPNISALDLFGTALDYTGSLLLVGSPGEDFGDSQANFGRVSLYNNPTRAPAWSTIRLQQPVVDLNLFNTVFMYDRITSASKQYFDYFDPLQGRLLGAVKQNIDYIGAVDPAAYNVGPVNNFGDRWAQARVGQIWWDTTNARFIDPNQDDIVYASRRWGQLFPGSEVEIYQWISSSAPPALYNGPGSARDDQSYVVTTGVNEQGIVQTTYYFWATGIRTVDRTARKTLSVDTLTRYIENPRSSGIAYIAPINSSTVAIYNGLPFISAQDTILHVEFDETPNQDAIHAEYQLIAQDRPTSFLTAGLYRKLQDSFCGVDSVGNPVPDIRLPISDRYGVLFSPRQSMFVNRFLALENYLVEANRVMALYPITEIRHFPLLFSQEPEPSANSGAWNQRVADYTELTYQDLAQVPVGYKYLVAVDSNNNDLWTIYEVLPGALIGSKTLGLIRVQNFKTRLYWNYIDWYQPGFNPLSPIVAEVPVFADLSTLSYPPGAYVKVTANGQGKFEIYQRTTTGWDRVALEDGTIAIDPVIYDYALGRFGFDVEVFDAQYFDQEPVIETRKIIQALNQEIFIDDLAIERNRLLILMFNFIMSEQIAPLWLVKTSLIDVTHVLRDLEPFQIYRQDNQDFVLNYINEVKPYHTQIREFNLIYRGQDLYQGTVTDFDVPAEFVRAQDMFISPVLDFDLDNPLSTTSSRGPDDPVWQRLPYNQWYGNYLLSIHSVDVVNSGSGYPVAPEVVVTGDCVTPAQMTARINSAGQLTGIVIVNPGLGYSTTASIDLVGGLPEGTQWQPLTSVEAGSVLITAGNNVYRVTTSGITGSIPPVSTAAAPTPIMDGTVLLTYVGTRAVAVARMGGSGLGLDYSDITPNGVPEPYNLVRSMTTTIKYDRYQYQTVIVDWQSNVNYDNGTLVRYADVVWEATSDDSTGVESATFDPDQWTRVPAADLSGVDRTMGYYVPTANEPGLDLALLISGIDYPGVQVDAPDFDENTGFDVGNYDINPFDNIAYGPEGQPTYDPAILDAIYQSEFTDPYLGTLPAPAYQGDPPNGGPNPIVVAGGAFVDTYSSHAPEELVPGAIYDTLDLRVFTTAGADWEADGHGWPMAAINYVFSGPGSSYSWDGLLEYPVSVEVLNQNNGVNLLAGVDYTVDWTAGTITVDSGIASGNTLRIIVYGLGGSDQIYRAVYQGSDLGSSLIVPRQFSIIQEIAIWVNADQYTNFTYSASGFNTEILFLSPITSSDLVRIFVLGQSYDQQTGLPILRSWSTPVTQVEIADGINFAWTLTASLQGTNPANIVVEKNGIRARPAEGVEYIGDGSSLQYYLPNRGGYDLNLVADNEVSVYINNQPLVLGVEFFVDPALSPSDRTITLASLPDAGDIILISVNHAANYYISGDTLIWRLGSGFVPIAGDVLYFTTFNDTSEQQLLTQVFQGPTTSGVLVSQDYDTTPYDVGTVTGAPGSFDYSAGSVITTNVFDTGRAITSTDRIEVTLNGFFLFVNEDFAIVDGTSIELFGPPINAADVVAITSYTQSTIPGEIAFRIFQDMRGAQATYRILASTTTTLSQALAATADVIYVADASRLSEPNLQAGLFGMITINGERITYRVRDLGSNSLSGLRRGTAGTGAADHALGAAVYDIGVGNLLPAEYQDEIEFYNELADGTTTVFTAPDIDLTGVDSTSIEEAVRVYVGGILQTGGYTITNDSPVSIVFATAPTEGYQVSIRVRRGLSWYEPGPSSPSNGIALQEQDTLAARFIRGA